MKLARNSSRLTFTAWETTASKSSRPALQQYFATKDADGAAVQGKTDDPNTIAPKGARDAGSSGAASGQQSVPSDEEVEKEGKKQGLDADDVGTANVKEGNKNKDSKSQSQNLSNIEREN